jgi:hypothetical protein
MIRTQDGNADVLVSRLEFALSGTHSRVVSAQSLLSLAALEIAEWKSEVCLAAPYNRHTIPLIAGPTRLIS